MPGPNEKPFRLLFYFTGLYFCLYGMCDPVYNLILFAFELSEGKIPDPMYQLFAGTVFYSAFLLLGVFLVMRFRQLAFAVAAGIPDSEDSSEMETVKNWCLPEFFCTFLTIVLGLYFLKSGIDSMYMYWPHLLLLDNMGHAVNIGSFADAFEKTHMIQILTPFVYYIFAFLFLFKFHLIVSLVLKIVRSEPKPEIETSEVEK